MRYGPSFENIAWSSLFLLAPLGMHILSNRNSSNFFQNIAKGLTISLYF